MNSFASVEWNDRGGRSGKSRWWTWCWWSFLAVLFTVLTALSARQIHGDSIKGDATQNLRIAYHLFHGNGFALRNRGPDGKPVSTNFREPLPPAVTALYLRMVLPSDRARDFSEWHHGTYTRLIKLGNLFWVFSGLIGCQLLAQQLLRHRGWALLTSMESYVFFFHNPSIVNSLYTELQAGTCMLWAAVLLVQGLQCRRWGWFAAAGGALGAMTLIKSVFLMVGPLAAGMALVVWAWREGRGDSWQAVMLRMALPLGLVFAVVVGPWMVRNKLVLDTWELSSGRSGYVMYKRALMDHMNADEYRLAFELYGPSCYKHWVQGTSLAIVYPDDMQRGGRLQRLNPYRSDFQDEDNRMIYEGRPERSLTFYRQSAAMYQKIRQELVEAGHPSPDLMADRMLKHEAVSSWLAFPGRHAMVSLLIAWRGFWWSFRVLPGPVPGLPAISNETSQWFNLGAGAALCLVFVTALIRRHAWWFAATVLPVLMMAAHAVLTHGLSRFNFPAIPFMMMAGAVCIRQLWLWLKPGQFQGFSPRR